MAEPKINFPVLKQGKAVPATPVQESLPAEKEPQIVYPVVQKGKAVPASQAKKYPSYLDGMSNEAKEKYMADREEERQANLAGMRGLTFGLSDRVMALLQDGKYEDNLKKIQAERDQYRADHPWAAMGNEMLGGVASGGAMSGALSKVGATLLPKVATYAQGVGLGPLATRLAQTAGQGAAVGELTSQMEKGPGEIGSDLGKGAAMGAVTGLGTTAAMKLAGVALGAGSRVGQRLALAAGAVKPESFANRKFNQSLSDQNLSPQDVADALKYLRGDDLQLHGPNPDGSAMADHRPPILVADALPKGTLNVVKKAVKSSDSAATKVTDVLKSRGADQGSRLQNNITATLSDDINSSAAQEALKAQRAAAAKPHYDQAYAVGAPNSPLIDQWITDRPVNAALFRELEQNLNANASKGLGQGRPMQAQLMMRKDGSLYWQKRPTIEDLDTIKKYIDSKRTDLWNPTKMEFNKPRQLGASDADQLKNQRDDLVKIIDQLTPDGQGGSHYANARKAFADDSELIEAHRAGQSIVRTRPEDVARQFDKYAGQPELQDQYRAGVAASISDLIDKADTDGGAAIVRKLYGNKAMQTKLTYVMGDPSTRSLFDRNMAAEKAMVDTQKELAPRSSPTDLLGDAEGFSLPLAAVHALSGRFGAAANQLGRFGTGAIGGMAPEVGDQLAKLALMSPEQFAAWNAAQQAAQQKLGPQVGKAVGALGQYMLNGVPAAVSGEAGRMSNDYNPVQPLNNDY